MGPEAGPQRRSEGPIQEMGLPAGPGAEGGMAAAWPGKGLRAPNWMRTEVLDPWSEGAVSGRGWSGSVSACGVRMAAALCLQRQQLRAQPDQSPLFVPTK